MRTTQGHTLRSLRAVQTFLIDHAERMPAVANAGARKKLDDVITELHAYAATQAGSDLTGRGAIGKRVTLRRTLVRGHMAPIARIARAALPQSPELEVFRVPRGKPTPERLAAAASGMAKAAEPHAAVFIEYGLPADFVARLTVAAEAMLDAVDNTKRHRGDRVGATKGIAIALSTGRKLVHILDAFVQHAIGDDLTLLTSWRSVSRVQRFTGRTLVPVGDRVEREALPPVSLPAAQAPRLSILASPRNWMRARRIVG
jgi:hypothetical protein